jgi:hypothetical protein
MATEDKENQRKWRVDAKMQEKVRTGIFPLYTCSGNYNKLLSTF